MRFLTHVSICYIRLYCYSDYSLCILLMTLPEWFNDQVPTRNSCLVHASCSPALNLHKVQAEPLRHDFQTDSQCMRIWYVWKWVYNKRMCSREGKGTSQYRRLCLKKPKRNAPATDGGCTISISKEVSCDSATIDCLCYCHGDQFADQNDHLLNAYTEKKATFSRTGEHAAPAQASEL